MKLVSTLVLSQNWLQRLFHRVSKCELLLVKYWGAIMTICLFNLTGNARVKTNYHFYVVTWKVGTMCISAAILCKYANTTGRRHYQLQLCPKKEAKRTNRSNLVFSCVAYQDRKKYWREFLSLLFNKGLKYNVAVLVWVAFASLRFLLLHLL